MRHTRHGMQTNSRPGRRACVLLAAGSLALGTLGLAPAAAQGEPSRLAVCMMDGSWQWSAAAGKWWYLYDDGSYAKDGMATIYDKNTGLTDTYCFDADGWMLTGWQRLGGIWFYFQDDGKRVTGWKQIGDHWYFFDGSGALYTGLVLDDAHWYFFDDSGAMVTGWYQLGEHWYYYGANGARVEGWQKIDGVWYYFEPGVTGYMATGFYPVGGETYYFEPSGAMHSGWLEYEGLWYLFDEAGRQLFGWQRVGDAWYYLSPYASGQMVKGWLVLDDKTYLMDDSGAMLTGWQVVGGTWHYFYPSGEMAKGTVVDGFYLDSDGKWVEGDTLLAQTKDFGGIWSATLEDLANGAADGQPCAGSNGPEAKHFMIDIQNEDPANGQALFEKLPVHGHSSLGTYAASHAGDQVTEDVTIMPFYVEPWITDRWYRVSTGELKGVRVELWLRHEGSTFKLSITSGDFCYEPDDGDIYVLKRPVG